MAREKKGGRSSSRRGTPAQFRFGAESATSIGPETAFQGALNFKENLKICGVFSGTIEAEGALYIEKGAKVEADLVSVSSLVLAGTLIGSVRAVDSVELLSGSVLKGNISAARLRIADDVLFEGQCNMTGIKEEIDIFSRSASEIKTELLGH